PINRDMPVLSDHYASSDIHTVSLHDALPICRAPRPGPGFQHRPALAQPARQPDTGGPCRLFPQRRGTPAPVAEPAMGTEPSARRSEEHTSELQSREKLVCRLLLEKKKSSLNH